MAEDEDLQAWIGFNTEDIFPASAHVLQALKQYPEATQLTQTGFNFAFDTVDKEPMFVTFGKDQARARRMGRAMASLTGGEGYEVSYLVNVEGGGYDFGSVDARGGTLVDIGGSHGVTTFLRVLDIGLLRANFPACSSSVSTSRSDTRT